MKAPEIADRFQRSLDKYGDLRIRILKLRALCDRSGVRIEEVLPLLPPDLQDQIGRL
jgi:hypothetical protein